MYDTKQDQKNTLLTQRRKTRLSSPRYQSVSRVEARETDQDIYEAMQAESASQYVAQNAPKFQEVQ